MVIVDDCQGTDMYTMARRDLLNHVTIKHRHISILLPQAILDGLTQNNQAKCRSFQTGELKQIKQLHENFATYVTFEEFMKVYNCAVSKPMDF